MREHSIKCITNRKKIPVGSARVDGNGAYGRKSNTQKFDFFGGSVCQKTYLKNIFELSFNEHISEELLNEWINQCKLGKLTSQQEFSEKEEWFIKTWMTKKPVNSEKCEKIFRY